MYILNLWQEYKIWRTVKKVAKENEELLNENGFRVDWIGRIYTVINLPEEVANHNPQIQQGYVLMQLRQYDEIFLRLGISDYVVPELQRIEGNPSFLLILSPDRDYIKLWPFIGFLFRTSLYLLALRIIYLIGRANWDSIIQAWTWLIGLLK
jgi:hypothetical protein